jgi:histidinol phosphatase-like enzyme (inositol monophosphatase family)
MTDHSLLMEAAAEVAQRAGAVALRQFGGAIQVDTKSDGSPVTIADRSAEEEARRWIEQRFPADAILGEELGTVDRAARRKWIIDPIDGTRSFVHGVPLWGTLVAVADGESVLAGAAYFPALGELLCAAPELGCWWNGARARVSTVARLSKATVLTTDETFAAAPQRRDAWRRLAESAALARSWGDCYGYLLVATGRAEVMVDGALADWDAAALLPAITEAGGVFTDWKGTPTAFGRSAIATNAALAIDTRRVLGATAQDTA